ERLRRRARLGDERSGYALERDEEVRRDRGAGVVDGALVVGELERTQAQGLCEPECASLRLVGLRRHARPGAVELLGAAAQRQRLQRMYREATRVRLERCERRAAR